MSFVPFALLEQDLDLERGDMLAEAGVRAAAEAEVGIRPAAEVELLRVVEGLGVEVARAKERGHDFALLDLLAVQLDLAGAVRSSPSPEGTPPRPGMTANLFAGATAVDLVTRIRATWLPVAGAGFAADPPELFDEMVRAVVERPTPYFAIVDQARAMAAWHGPDRLARITAPATVLHGSDDPLIPVRNGMRGDPPVSRPRVIRTSRAPR